MSLFSDLSKTFMFSRFDQIKGMNSPLDWHMKWTALYVILPELRA